MNVYISGPITGTADFEDQFEKAQRRLELSGYTVFNIVACCKALPEQVDYETYMKIAFALIDECDAVYMLEGWRKSTGANRELGYAIGRNKEIMYQKEQGW